MKTESRKWWGVRVLWPLSGGAWGAWVAVRGLSHPLPQLGGDTLAALIAWGFIAFSILIGLIVGLVSAALVAGLVEWVLRSCGVGIVTALSVATLVCMLSLWQITEFALAKYPALRAGRTETAPHRKATGVLPPAEKGPYRNPCLDPPPADAKERASWEAECR